MTQPVAGSIRHRASALVGRDKELRLIDELLTNAVLGHGRAVFLVGDSGIGKSRLAATAAERGFALNMSLLRGRGSTVGPMVPFRPLTEALLSLLRASDPIEVSELGAYRAVLARLIPDWGVPAADDGVSLVILAEAMLRLTALAGKGRGCLMVLDDLQDADAETLAVIEYCVDNLKEQPTVLLGTIRDEPCPALDMVRSAAQRGACVLLELDRLGKDDLSRLVQSRLGVRPGEVSEAVVDLLWAGSVGNPFLAEELLCGIVDDGLLLRGDGGWRMAERGLSELPATFARGLTRRIGLLTPPARELLLVAAVLGQRFPFAVVQAATGMADRRLLSLLHGELAGQLVTPDDQTPDWYAFKHRLIRDALLMLLTASERAELAAKAADAVDAVYPGLPGEWCQVSAALRLEAGDPVRAGRLLAEAGRRALAQGMASSAVTLLDNTWELLSANDVAERATTLENLLYALAEAGMVERALASIRLLDQVGGLDRRRRAQLHTRLAWAAAVAGRTDSGLAQVEAAMTLLGPDAEAEDLAPVEVVAAHLALDVAGPDQLQTAEAMARRAATVAEAVPMPVVACQAWQILGAITRTRDPDEATTCLERARTLAVQHDLPIWEIHALVRLGNDEALRYSTLERLEQAREQASAVGAITAQYQSEASIAFYTILMADFEAAETLINQVLTATTRLKLLETAHYVLVLRAVLAGHRGRRHDLDVALAEYRRWNGESQPQNLPRIYGLARTFCALLEENRDRAREELTRALKMEEASPTVLPLSGRYGMNLLLQALDGQADWRDYRSVTAAPASRLRWDRQFAEFARAVIAGRSGRGAEATAAVAEAMTIGEPYAMGKHLGLRLVGEAALADRWGTPVEWLRTAEGYFHSQDVTPMASACRALLRSTGVRVARHRTGAEDVPVHLRSVGVTVREYEVLRLLGGRLANREIAQRLHLSTRTVERHVSNLLSKTGRPNRIALSEFAGADARSDR